MADDYPGWAFDRLWAVSDPERFDVSDLEAAYYLELERGADESHLLGFRSQRVGERPGPSPDPEADARAHPEDVL